MVHFLWVWLNGSFPVGVSPVLRFGNEVQFYVADVHVCKKCLPIILPTFVVQLFTCLYITTKIGLFRLLISQMAV